VALTVRREGAASGGTIGRPIPVAIDLSRVNPAPIERRQQLGYEALPSTAVYGISSPRRFELRLARDGSDRYAVHIQITLIDSTGQAVAAVTSACGQLEWQQLPAGDYRIIAALLIPEQVELGLTIEARPHRVRLANAIAAGQGGGSGRLGRGIPLIASGASPHQLRLEQPALQGQGGGGGGGQGQILAVQGSTARCRSIAAGSGSATAQLAPMTWVDDQGREMGAGIFIVPAALDAPELVTGTDWAVIVRLVDQGTGALRDLSDLTFTGAIWNQDRSQRYALCSITITSPTAGGPVISALTPEQSAAVGLYDGEVVVFDLSAVDGTGALAYLLTGDVTVRWGVSTPDP
jgi:hypothetical protein